MAETNNRNKKIKSKQLIQQCEEIRQKKTTKIYKLLSVLIINKVKKK
jgi:hypothetical protein